MSKSFSRFGPDMKRLSTKVEKNARVMISEIVAKSGTQLARETPIDTGRASGNWQGSVGSPILAESGVFFPGSSVGQMQIFKGAAISATGTPPMFLTNMVPYMQYLNRGWSPQAPTPFWIERGIEKNILAVMSNKRYKLLRS